MAFYAISIALRMVQLSAKPVSTTAPAILSFNGRLTVIPGNHMKIGLNNTINKSSIGEESNLCGRLKTGKILIRM